MSTVRRVTAMAAASTALLAAVATAQPAFASVPSGVSGPHAGPHAISGGNWAGYADTGVAGSFTSVSSSWVEPTISCGSQNTYSSLWVGLDGFDNSALEQTGTEMDCVNGLAEYGAWWEVLPASESVYSGVTLRGGDHISASVTYNGSSNFTMTLTDSTQGWTKTTTHKGSSGFQNSSAEIISEATSVGGSIAPVTPYTVTFSGSLANGSAFGGFDPQQITASGAKVSPIIGGETFTVTWGNGTGSPTGV